MHLFAAAIAIHCLTLYDRFYQLKPFAVRGRVSKSIHAARTQRTDRVILSQAVTRDELLNGRLMCAVVAGGARGMILVEWSVLQDLFMDCARGDEDEAPHICAPCLFDQSQRPQDVSFGKLNDVPLGAAKSGSGSKE